MVTEANLWANEYLINSEVFFDHILDLYYSSKQEHEQMLCWIINQEFWGRVMKFKDANGNYLIDCFGNNLLGLPIHQVSSGTLSIVPNHWLCKYCGGRRHYTLTRCWDGVNGCGAPAPELYKQLKNVLHVRSNDQ